MQDRVYSKARFGNLCSRVRGKHCRRKQKGDKEFYRELAKRELQFQGLLSYFVSVDHAATNGFLSDSCFLLENQKPEIL